MKSIVRILITISLLFAFPTFLSAGISSRKSATLRVLVVTGGHEFEREPFFDMFRSFPGMLYQEVAHPSAHEMLTPAKWSQYDAIVLYDMWQPITEDAKKQFVSLLKRGKGLVALHHSMASYNDWPEYAKIIGGKYRLNKEGDKEPSKYEHDVRYKVSIRGKHYITEGTKDFRVHDETYSGFDVEPGVFTFLTTDEKSSGKTIGWAKSYGNSRIVTIQPGHGPDIFENPNYRRILERSIRWVAEREHESVQ